MAHRVAIRQHHAIFDIDIDIAVSNIYAVDDLTNIDMRDACTFVRIRVLTDSECILRCQTTSQVIFNKTPSNLYRVGVRTERKDIGLYLIRIGAKNGVRMNRAKPKGLA